MKRPIAAGLVALAVAIVVWRTAARSATSAPAGRTAAAADATAGRKTDPRQAARAEIHGHVAAAGKPVAGAHVCADASGIGELGRDATCTDSDAAGAYAIGDLLTAEYRVSANARGMRPTSAHQHLDAGAHATIDLALPAGGVELTGTVTDISGGPIAHAQLRGNETVVESDDQGAFSLWVAPGDLSITASADGYAPADWNGQAPDRVELRLEPESSLAGTVVGTDGEPVAGAHVEVSGIDWRQPSVDTTSGDDGTFHADRLAPGRYTITVRSPHAYGQSESSILVGLAEHTDGVIVTVLPAFEVAGTLAGEDGKPCDGSLRLVDEDHARSLDGWGDATTGAVEVDGVLPGTYKVTASCTGFLSKDAAMLEVKDHDLTGQKWTVEAGATVRGHITLRDGSPVEGAEVRFQGGSWGNATTAADGSYSVSGLAAGGYQVVVSSLKGMQSADRDTLDVAERATVDHDVVLEVASAIRGVVVDTRGVPLAGADVRLRDIYVTGRTAADGSFVLQPVPAGDHEIVVELADHYFTHPGAADPEEPAGRVSVETGEIATTRLVVELETAMIAGTVVDAAGAPVRDAYVDVTPSGGETSPAILTGDDGAFRFPAIRNAKYHLHAYAPGRGEKFLDADPGEALKVQLESGAITGTVRGAPEELSVMISGTSYRTETFFHTGGRFALQDLRPGHYDVVFDSESGHAEQSLDVGDGPGDPLDITPDPVFTLTGRVVRGDTHAPVGDVHVQMRIGYQRLPDDGDGAVTDAAGRFTIRRARRGTAEIRIASTDDTQWLELPVSGPDMGDVELPAEQPAEQQVEYDVSE